MGQEIIKAPVGFADWDLKQKMDFEDMLTEAVNIVSESINEDIQRLAADGWTQAEIAEACGRTPNAISKRMVRLGIETKSNRGRPRKSKGITPGRNSPDPELEQLRTDLEKEREKVAEAEKQSKAAEKLAKEAREARQAAEKAVKDEAKELSEAAILKMQQRVKDAEAKAKATEEAAAEVKAQAAKLEATFEERVKHAIEVKKAVWNPADKAAKAAGHVLNARNALIDFYTEPPSNEQGQRLDAAIGAILAMGNQMKAFRAGMKDDLDEGLAKLLEQEYGNDS